MSFIQLKNIILTEGHRTFGTYLNDPKSVRPLLAERGRLLSRTADLVGLLAACIQNGIDLRRTLVPLVAQITGTSPRIVGNLLTRYEGADPAESFWRVEHPTPSDRRYTLLTPAPAGKAKWRPLEWLRN